MNTEKGSVIASMGGYGGEVIDDTDAHTPTSPYNYVAIQAIEDSTITAVGDIDGLSAISVSAGFVIYGTFTSITLGSGSVIAYLGG